jgi:hypothetical protein
VSSYLLFFPNKLLKELYYAPNSVKKKTTLALNWTIDFNSGKVSKTIITDSLFDWSQHPDSTIKYYSGTAGYQSNFNWSGALPAKNVELDLGRVEQLATVFVNQLEVGIVWAPPYVLNIAPYLKKGANTIEIQVTNTWFNRLLGDAALQPSARQTFTNAPLRFEGKKGQPSGLLGPIIISE